MVSTLQRFSEHKNVMIEVPESKGAYLLIVSVKQTQRLVIGQLGRCTFIPGFYGYLESACGHGGIRARISRHLASVGEPHWHIDYLLNFATPIEVWYALSDRKLEQEWAEMLQHSGRFQTPIALRCIGLSPQPDDASVLFETTPFVSVVRGEGQGGLQTEHPTAASGVSDKLRRLMLAQDSVSECHATRQDKP